MTEAPRRQVFAMPPLTPEDDGLGDGYPEEPEDDLDDELADELDDPPVGGDDGDDSGDEIDEELEARFGAAPDAPAAALSPVPPPALAAARPTADDPELTALAAALFGPRAQTPSHPRPDRGSGR